MKNYILLALTLLLVVGCSHVGSDPVTIPQPFTYIAPGDDGIEGQASLTQIRMALSASDLQTNWDNCTIISEHTPWSPGVRDTIDVSVEVETGVDYYFALKVADEVLNWSVLSNIITRSYPDVTPPSPVGDFDFAN